MLSWWLPGLSFGWGQGPGAARRGADGADTDDFWDNLITVGKGEQLWATSRWGLQQDQEQAPAPAAPAWAPAQRPTLSCNYSEWRPLPAPWPGRGGEASLDPHTNSNYEFEAGTGTTLMLKILSWISSPSSFPAFTPGLGVALLCSRAAAVGPRWVQLRPARAAAALQAQPAPGRRSAQRDRLPSCRLPSCRPPARAPLGCDRTAVLRRHPAAPPSSTSCPRSHPQCQQPGLARPAVLSGRSACACVQLRARVHT